MIACIEDNIFPGLICCGLGWSAPKWVTYMLFISRLWKKKIRSHVLSPVQPQPRKRLSSRNLSRQATQTLLNLWDTWFLQVGIVRAVNVALFHGDKDNDRCNSQWTGCFTSVALNIVPSVHCFQITVRSTKPGCFLLREVAMGNAHPHTWAHTHLDIWQFFTQC